MPNLAALHATVFLLSAKNRWGGHMCAPPAVRGLDMSHTRIMSIHRLLMRLFSAFCGGKALNGNFKHFVFDLTCDVPGDHGVKFFNLIWKISSSTLHCRLKFSATSIGCRDRWGPLRPPPPPPAEGRGRTRPSRVRDDGGVKKLTWPLVTDTKNLRYTRCRYLSSYETLKVLNQSDK